MKLKNIVYSFLIILFISSMNDSFAQDNLWVWKEFTIALKKGQMTAERVHPYDSSTTQTFVEWLKILNDSVSKEELDVVPEIHQNGNEIKYLIPLDSHKVNVCFTMVLDNNTWYLRHLETISIRLDSVSSLPASKFPDIPEETKAWIREELYWSQQVYLLNILSSSKGKSYALGVFNDGAGYALAAKVWVPLVSPEKAFILYLCWEQTNLRGNNLILEQLNGNEAIIRFKYMIYLELYKRASHLKNLISYEDYWQLFTSIWQDRAKSAGWNLQIITNEQNGEVVFHFHLKG